MKVDINGTKIYSPIPIVAFSKDERTAVGIKAKHIRIPPVNNSQTRSSTYIKAQVLGFGSIILCHAHDYLHRSMEKIVMKVEKKLTMFRANAP